MWIFGTKRFRVVSDIILSHCNPEELKNLVCLPYNNVAMIYIDKNFSLIAIKFMATVTGIEAFNWADKISQDYLKQPFFISQVKEIKKFYDQ